MMDRQRDLVNRCLVRLGKSVDMPETFIRYELALAVRRFGIWPILKTAILMERNVRRWRQIIKENQP